LVDFVLRVGSFGGGRRFVVACSWACGVKAVVAVDMVMARVVGWKRVGRGKLPRRVFWPALYWVYVLIVCLPWLPRARKRR
jgi:hypothetical protein